MDFVLAPLQQEFMVRALIASTLIGLVCSVVGVYVVLRNLSFIGDGIAHASFAGIVIAYLFKFNLYVGGLIVAILTALGIGSISRRSDVSLDTAIGVMFTAVFALGVLLMSRARNYIVDLQDFLFGNVLSVDRTDIMLVSGLTIGVLLVVFAFYKELLFASFDPLMAQASGIPTVALSNLLLVILAVTIIVSLQAAGIVLVAALLVTPAAAAYQLTNRFATMMAASAAIGVGSAIVGLYASYYLNAASGSTIVLTATFCFFAAMAFSPKRRSLLTQVVAARRRAQAGAAQPAAPAGR
ncbi:MAG: metal ABC transporter permease [Candidatus Eremiobacteraeota bacterium]|nr:metal ABC transporter permease [Candidatus Eremiobacteraeota bacterium]MBV8366337.1 metal ABC transporter permease [Candidatus Eremiobacteraeota bacterium]